DVADLDALRRRPRGGWRGCGGTLDATDETRGESDAPDKAHDASGPHGMLLEEAGTSTAATTAAVSTTVANSPWRSDRAIAWISSARYSIPSGPTRSKVAAARGTNGSCTGNPMRLSCLPIETATEGVDAPSPDRHRPAAPFRLRQSLARRVWRVHPRRSRNSGQPRPRSRRTVDHPVRDERRQRLRRRSHPPDR